MRRISDDIYYIGVDDVNSPLFENQYPVPEGMARLRDAVFNRPDRRRRSPMTRTLPRSV